MLEKTRRRITQLITALSGIAILGIVVCVVLAVLDRTIFKFGFFWTEEVARTFYVWFTLIGASVSIAHNSHFRMTYFIDKFMKARSRQMLLIIQSIAVCITLIMLTFAGIQLCYLVRNQLMPSIRMSINAMYASAPTGFALMSATYLVAIAKYMSDYIHMGENGLDAAKAPANSDSDINI